MARDARNRHFLLQERGAARTLRKEVDHQPQPSPRDNVAHGHAAVEEPQPRAIAVERAKADTSTIGR